VFGRQEKRAWEAGFPRWHEVGEKEKNYATLCNILQSKKCKEAGANKSPSSSLLVMPTNTGQEPRIKGMGSGSFKYRWPNTGGPSTSLGGFSIHCCSLLFTLLFLHSSGF